MKLIIDTNVIFSGLIRNSTTRTILLSPFFEFYVPDFYDIEFKKYKSLILEKFGGSEKELREIIDLLHEKIIVVIEEEYLENMDRAQRIIGGIDPKDVPFIALALSIKNDGIWTRDKQYFLYFL